MPDSLDAGADRLVSPQATEEGATDPALRPQMLDDFTGQRECVRHLRIFIDAARARGEAIDHVLLFGPPGLGKTTLAQIVANEMRFAFQAASAPAITKPGDLAAILMSLEPWSVLFIDEIHRLNKIAAEMLYTAMEDRHIDLVIGEGPSARSVRLDLQPFTLIGATTRSGMLPAPLRDRFGIHLRLEYYETEDLAQVVARAARLMGIDGDDEAWFEIAGRSRGTPRVAKRLLRRVRDFAHAEKRPRVDAVCAQEALEVLGVDANGLDGQDRRYLDTLVSFFGGGPVGIETLAASLTEDRDILESSVEPYLMMKGFLQRTRQGRVVTDLGRLAVVPASTPTVPPAAKSLPAGPRTRVEPRPAGNSEQLPLGLNVE